MPDILIIGYPTDTLFLLFGKTDVGTNWIEEKVEATTRLGNAVAVEHRYVDAIAEGAKGDGLSVEWRAR